MELEKVWKVSLGREHWMEIRNTPAMGQEANGEALPSRISVRCGSGGGNGVG